MSDQEANSVKEVVKEFTEADNAIKTVFSKVDPILVVRLIFDEKAKKENIYTLEIILKPEQDTQQIRERVISVTGMAPGFYLKGTKMVVSHSLDLDLLKRINDLDFVVSIKGSPYSAGGSSDF
ncbi:MAG: hypothetical protein WA390_02120 [Nitrososphaeraceae archaeon]|jgi:hypothetical protein|nr:hypothetical protein [Nitrososphaeraceae archaeon]MDW0136695.1 hypothetical protein [Nitrososphaeraceae archaeon]MDW0139011.1 hypothetical protein [Nitrososphaeraceae archaeon]MDW0142474.1 hypothetical protein [Nitrososphaeraceae archaeon]MDW0143654.1 hypothetical protein [Nitrososphaeraceae archaeon]